MADIHLLHKKQPHITQRHHIVLRGERLWEQKDILIFVDWLELARNLRNTS